MSVVDALDAHRAGRRLGAIEGAQHCADEGAAIADRLDADLDLAVRSHTIQSVLDPLDRYQLTGRASRRRHAHRVTLERDHGVRATRECPDLLADESFEYAAGVVARRHVAHRSRTAVRCAGGAAARRPR